MDVSCYTALGNPDALPDELLVWLAQGDGAHPAAQLLFQRHYDWISRVLAYEARRWHLPHPDGEDACQEAVWTGFCYALAHFDPWAGSGQARFLTYLALTLRSRLEHAVRSQRRLASHFDRTQDVHRLLDWDLRGLSRQGRQSPRCAPDEPALEQEWREQLEGVLRDVPDPARRLLLEWASGVSIVALARDQACSPRTISRRIQQSLHDLRRRWPGPP